MKILKSAITIGFFASILTSCNDAYLLKLSSPKTLQVHQKLNVSVSEENDKPIDSIRYYLDGQRLTGNTEISISDKKLGRHAISATIFYGEGTKQLTNTIIFLNETKPDIYDYQVINEFPHDKNAFTQGLEFYNGFLYESTGQFGESSLRKVELTTGKVLQKIDLDKQYFGEGITIFNGKIYMLTWQNKKGFVFDLDSFKLEKEFNYSQSKEGWGLSHTPEKLIKTDGTERLWFLDPETLREETFVEVYTDKRKVSELNEIEFINGKVYSNKWQANSILIINIDNGAIEGIVDLKGLQSKAGQKGDDNVLNGIAYDAKNDRLFVTGKDWDKVFEIKLFKKQ